MINNDNNIPFLQKENLILADKIGELCRKHSLSLSTAESCTGGLISSYITKIDGSSTYFLGGVVTYNEKIKTSLIGVNPNDIKCFGVVSKQVAEQMSAGVSKLMNTDISLSTTGLTGMSDDEFNKAGTVWIGLKIYDSITSEKFYCSGSRLYKTELFVNKALNLLLDKLSCLNK